MNGMSKIIPQDALHGAKVLVVEDDFIVSLELRSVLEDAGAEVTGVCSSIDEAISLASDVPLAAAVLDFRLGQKTVTPVARMLAERGTPIVFYTGQTEQRRRLLDLCPHSRFIPKPTPPQRVVAAIAELLHPAPAASGGDVARV